MCWHSASSDENGSLWLQLKSELMGLAGANRPSLLAAPKAAGPDRLKGVKSCGSVPAGSRLVALKSAHD
jgi:hypothetical protein